MLALVGEMLQVPIFSKAAVVLEKNLIWQSIWSQQE